MPDSLTYEQDDLAIEVQFNDGGCEVLITDNRTGLEYQAGLEALIHICEEGRERESVKAKEYEKANKVKTPVAFFRWTRAKYWLIKNNLLN